MAAKEVGCGADRPSRLGMSSSRTAATLPTTPMQRCEMSPRARNYEACKEAIRSVNLHGHSEIIDSKTIAHRLKEPSVREQDGLQAADMVLLPKIRLYEGINRMGPTRLKCLILKLDKFDEDKFRSFSLLKNFRNPAVVTLQAFYEDANLPRVVLSWVDARLDDYVRSPEGPEMFFEDTPNGHGLSLSALNRRFIINMCTGLDGLFKEGLYPRKIRIDDLYLCHVGSKDTCLKILTLSVDQIKDPAGAKTRRAVLWEEVREVARKIKRITDNTIARSISKKSKFEVIDIKSLPLSAVALRFISYIGHDTNMLKRYPDTWSYREKGEYLFSIVSADKAEICQRLQRPGVLLQWPVDPKTKKLPHLLVQLIENDNKRSFPYYYKVNVPYDYVLLCRTVYKHFDSLRTQVTSLRDLCQKPADFLERMERWKPEIWCILYDAIGVPDEPQE